MIGAAWDKDAEEAAEADGCGGLEGTAAEFVRVIGRGEGVIGAARDKDAEEAAEADGCVCEGNALGVSACRGDRFWEAGAAMSAPPGVGRGKGPGDGLSAVEGRRECMCCSFSCSFACAIIRKDSSSPSKRIGECSIHSGDAYCHTRSRASRSSSWTSGSLRPLSEAPLPRSSNIVYAHHIKHYEWSDSRICAPSY